MIAGNPAERHCGRMFLCMYMNECVPLLIVESMLYKAYEVFLQIPFYLMFLYYSTPFSLFAVSATHKETKQFFTLYNTLDDKKVYLEKEVRKCYYCFLSIQSGKGNKKVLLGFHHIQFCQSRVTGLCK